MFPTIDKNEGFPQRELSVLEFWKSQEIYHKSLAKRADAPPFVFYEGPPTANGMPHPGHCLTRAIKDLFPRYKTMRGYRCERKAGWDTHGLPVEVEVCKELGIHAKEEIEAYGVEPFIQKCQQSVWRYMQEWRRLTERLGFWVDLEEAYVTYHQSYVESVWWSLKTLFDRGLLYRGHKIVWWWAQGGTALSAGEVGQGYREVADPSVYVKFPLLDDDGRVTDTSLLVWTTTPWTLPSNQFVAVNPDVTYVEVQDNESGDNLILAQDLLATICDKVRRKFEYKKTHSGKSLIEKRYQPPFDIYWQHRARSNWHHPDALSYGQLMGAGIQIVGDSETFAQTEFEQDNLVKTWLQNHPPDNGWQIVRGNFVTTESGTGLVHIAPAFGEDDYNALQQRNWLLDPDPPLINAVAPDGKFTSEGPEYCRGRWVKDCDKDITRDLKSRGLLFHQEQYRHDYPFCWRAEEDPLIQYPRESWFIRTTEFKDQMLANNAEINWLPDHIRDGRFGKFLESNVDWALSRERYWGTPLPIWVCEETGQMEAVSSYGELMAKPGVTGSQVWLAAKEANPELPDDLRVHKPYIDVVTYDSPFAQGARMQRVSEVIDCWYDSGAMPFAQWGYRGQDSGSEREQFESQFPADFISEALDQTRGWFYSQLAISTLMFGKGKGESGKGNEENPLSPFPFPLSEFPHPFKNCIVLGLMLGEDGQKMSKSKRNYREPNEIFDRYGADALRWYLFANQPPWTSIRYSEQAIKDSIPEFLLRLWNVYSFFTIYANIDEFDPGQEIAAGEFASVGGPSKQKITPSDFQKAKTHRPLSDRSELDRWILSELEAACASVVERMDDYDNFGACQAITAYVDGLSNWYVRRSRDRFWAKEKRTADKLDAYWTLYECLLKTAQLIAPFVPFLAERLWQDLAVAVFGDSVEESVHLCDFPTGNAATVDAALSEQMQQVRLISSLGRQARSAAELKVRQPLAKVEVILADLTHRAWLEEHADVIADELNVKAVEYTDEPEKYVDHEVVPNFKLLGPKLGKLMPKVKGTLAKQSGSELLANLRDNGKIDLVIDGQEVALTPEEVEIRIQAKSGWTSANDKGVVVVLATEVTPELLAEGWMRDLVRVIQDQRKEIGCEFTDRIELAVVSESVDFKSALESHRDYVMKETLASSLSETPLAGRAAAATKIGDSDVELYVQVAS